MDSTDNTFKSTALEINLERTKATVEIPEKYRVLMGIMEGHYGILRRLEDLLVELNHPFVNWEYVLTRLKGLSIGDFYDFNRHDEGLEGLRLLSDIYISTISTARDERVQDSAVRYLFEFINTVIGKSQEKLERNMYLISLIFSSLLEFARKGEHPFLRKSSTYLKVTVGLLREQNRAIDFQVLRDLLYIMFRETYDFWTTQPDPSGWYVSDGDDGSALAEFHRLVAPLSHGYMGELLDRLDALHSETAASSDRGIWDYLDMPDYFQITNGYLLVADDLERSEVFAGRSFLVKLDFLFHALNVPGLIDIHASGLIEINRCLGKVFQQTKDQDLQEFVRRVFTSMRRTIGRSQFQSKIIDCITTLAKGVFDQNNHPLVDSFIEELIGFGFQYPDIEGSTSDWQIRANPSHIENIRSWLRIVAFRPRWTKRLLSALVINLNLQGVFVKDTDLFQKEISAFLNSGITPSYNLVKQLLRLFPIFFTEIGAEGELRETSTNVDELSARNDKLIFFLRKQSHVESNSLLVPFTEDIFRYWATGEKAYIKPHLPQEVFDQVRNEGEFFDELHITFKNLLIRAKEDPRNFLEWDASRITKEVKGIRRISDRERERARLMLRYYQLIYKKYNHQHIDLLRDLEISCIVEIPRIRSLKRALKKKDHYAALNVTLDMLSGLKERILSPIKTDYFENIYHKRHIAAGIPSMYGTYREEKFEAMGLTFRLESLATVLFDKLIQSLNLKFITKSTLMRIHEYLWLYVKALDVDGVATEGLVSKMRYITAALQIRQFSIDQYIDIFQFISKQIQDIIRDYYIDSHTMNLPVIIGQIMSSQGRGDGEAEQSLQEAVYRQSENFIRSIIGSAFGLQVFDNFINSIIRALGQEVEKFKDNKQILNLVMAYIPELTISPIYKKRKEIDNQILIGNKGYFLKEMASLGFPVPSGFIITTEVFRGYEAVIGYKYIFKDLSSRIFSEIQALEHATGKKFGNPRNPLLLSVRSGATISLPGMMHSFLNVGLNETIADGLSRFPEYRWAAWDSYRRFLQTWGMFQGLERNIFDEVMNSYKARYGVSKKIEFEPDQMRQLALSYKKAMEDRGIIISNDPHKQLQEAIMLVFGSWYSQQARIYRHQMHVSDEWGTAVIVQAMVFGNLNENSGSGVIFTRDPRGSSQNVVLYGDFIFGVQGDDIVSGLVETYPISEKQRVSEMRPSVISLQKRFPDIYGELVRIAEFLVYEKRFNHQEIEFTFETATPKGLYILQTRDMVQRGAGKVLSFKDSPELERSQLGIGIGVSGGALAGRVVYSEEEIEHYRRKDDKEPLILIRPDTVPDDVGIILKVEGILTARGGGTSHAAVTIPQLNKVGVVGFSKLHVYENEAYSICEEKVIKGGDFISIDGWTGAVYVGKHEIEKEESYKITL
ncbi:MAG: PEP/pyruvate-binding domain-containing protein [Syntrophorhabdaceae bacterium]|nr:PEP/pyruvate-binding domain-containing protein [Syntrophorhabdaceae bacterium]